MTVPTFETLSPRLLNKITALGQQLARRMKEVYPVERVAFPFTGGDVAHVHAHVVPMHAKADITSARYVTSTAPITWGSAHLAHVAQLKCGSGRGDRATRFLV